MIPRSRWLVTFTLLLSLISISACDRSSSDLGDTLESPSVKSDRTQEQSVASDGTIDQSKAEDSKGGSTGLGPASFDRDTAITNSERLAREGKLDQAAQQLQRGLLADPDDVELLFRMARLEAGRGDLRSSVELLDSIPSDHPEAGLPALGQAADWYMKLEEYDKAESRYLRVLEKVPGAAVAHRQLAYLYNRQGRRHEAATHLRALCRLGNIQQDELHGLMVLAHAMIDDPNKVAASPSPKPRPYYPIGPAAKARMFYTADRFAEAVEELDELVRSGAAKPSVMAFYGLLAMEAQDVLRFQWWLSRVGAPNQPETVQTKTVPSGQASETKQSVQYYAEYWAAIGAFLLGERRFEEAVRALAEAIDRDPTNIGAMRRISQALTALGRNEEADRWMDRYVTQRDVTLASNAIGESQTPDLESYATVSDGLDKLERPLEATTWRLFEAFYRKAPRDEIESLNQKRTALFESKKAFADRDFRLCGIAIDEFPMPNLEIPDQVIADQEIAVTPESELSDVSEGAFPIPQFQDMASDVGLQHTYQVASKPQPYRFALYQSLGGAIAVLDYDLDGAHEFYLAQGSGDPPSMTGELSNLLYRQVDGEVRDRTQQAGVADHNYTVGATSGDWNQDGFDDLVLGNIGGKVLLINQGDGTFQRFDFDADVDHDVLISSMAMGDLSGDGLPDLYSAYYVEDVAMLDRPKVDEIGNILTISPAAFVPGVDRLTINDGQGGVPSSSSSQKMSESDAAPSTGLGVVLADWDGKPGNEVFVGNDIRPNHLWVRSPDNNDWIDSAAVAGCSHGVGGAETASMGIAVADFDNNGTRDIHITNFYLESVSLFMNSGGTFRDRCVQYQLQRDSSTVLGFGCQALDYNNDGLADLAVTNGNIEKAPGEPLEQSPQFFVNRGGRFKLQEVDDASGYWQGEYLGRAMARLDFDRDGRQDIMVSHLGAPTALLMNQTETSNHWLTVQLAGVGSERGAISAQVDVHAGNQVLSGWIVGGDGYLCRNEPTVSFGIGETSVIDKVVVTWPSGEQQEFEGIAVDRRLLLVEGQKEQFEFLP